MNTRYIMQYNASDDHVTKERSSKISDIGNSHTPPKNICNPALRNGFSFPADFFNQMLPPAQLITPMNTRMIEKRYFGLPNSLMFSEKIITIPLSPMATPMRM